MPSAVAAVLTDFHISSRILEEGRKQASCSANAHNVIQPAIASPSDKGTFPHISSTDALAAADASRSRDVYTGNDLRRYGRADSALLDNSSVTPHEAMAVMPPADAKASSWPWSGDVDAGTDGSTTKSELDVCTDRMGNVLFEVHSTALPVCASDLSFKLYVVRVACQL